MHEKITIRRYQKGDHKEVFRLYKEGLNQMGVFIDNPSFYSDLDDIEGIYNHRNGCNKKNR